MKRIGLVIGLVLTLVCAGCKPSDPMPGKWKLYIAGESQIPIGGNAEFKSDKTCEIRTSFGMDKWSFKGTYSIDGKTLRIDGEMEEKAPAVHSSKGPENRPAIDRKEKLVATGTLSDDFKTFRIDGKNFQKE